jgi:hypothetical protein
MKKFEMHNKILDYQPIRLQNLIVKLTNTDLKLIQIIKNLKLTKEKYKI